MEAMGTLPLFFLQKLNTILDSPVFMDVGGMENYYGNKSSYYDENDSRNDHGRVISGGCSDHSQQFYLFDQ